MSKRNHFGSLGHQVYKTLFSKTAFGESRHQAKASNSAFNKIFSYQTYHTYMKACNRFANYCKTNFNCKTLAECEKHINSFIQSRRNLSPYTQKMELCAIGKLYGKSYFDSVETSPRSLDTITRSRYDSTSSLLNIDSQHPAKLIALETGMRKHEIRNLKGQSIRVIDGKSYVVIENGKGGLSRMSVLATQSQQIIDLIQNTPADKYVIDKMPRLPWHSFRRAYAQKVYEMMKEKDFSKLEKKDLYYCRGSHRGTCYSRKSLTFLASQLGHQRLSVCMHYLR